MITVEFSIILFGFSCLAGFIGALTGLGGGVIIIPALVILLNIDIHYAMGASLISVIATSSGTAVAYLREGYTNLRIGMFLETAAVVGAFFGALLVAAMSTSILAIIFGVVLIFSALLSWKQKEKHELIKTPDPLAKKLQLEGSYPTVNGPIHYVAQKVLLSWGIMGIAGLLSGLLGVGSGALKVLAMDQAMRLPYKVATTTSNFMIGLTAAVGSGIYLTRGYINPYLTFPVVIGVLLGAFLGAKLLMRLHNKILRIIFSFIIFLLALEMIYKGATGNL